MSVVDEIAKALGVSGASVSRALNDRPGVSAELRERVLAKARELHYTPTLTARGLATSQTFNIGFFFLQKAGLPAAADPFYTEILHSVQQVIARSDYHVAFETLTPDTLAHPVDFRFVRERRIDAMILAGPDIPAGFINAMLHTKLPLVLVDNRLDFTPVNCVNSDDETGAYLAAQHLLNLGHTKIGVIAGPTEWASTARRVWGYHRALSEVEVVHMNETTIESGREAYRRLSGAHPEITAIAAVNDSMAIGAIREAHRRGLCVPDDLSVVGFDDIAWAELNDPPLTTLRIPRQQMGKEAAHRVLMLLQDPDLLASEIIVPVHMVERNSTAPRR
ncbi:MAG: LacI family DNA-binding transcriptional regulator [Anaerolineae bacterium]|jgi:DNA-binding LacI/PurR family transcriptional regulator|uniref:LacI family DNA-binding transcriptional regulator n=1 Tax=Candidatus Flexifilum breve TaxID=3140694 RepID=UPI001AC9B9C7|nr:LacI family DNA-binding transcriptional regulator [Chloroflexota bacterium]MBK9747742.1 LacI family DNA-binding transcriptional regulator [Chloroflexota bacterium]MBN8636161.1 LacI family DNA-binding transcriptional regulator [Anaerolineae bacterium]